MPVSAKSAAAYLSKKSDWKLSNLELQKILYMAAMNYAGQTGMALVSDDFEAWDYGPVLPRLYHDLKIFGSSPVGNVYWGAESILGRPEAQIIERAFESLKGQTPGQLVENTHWYKGAWAKNYVTGARGKKIPLSDMIAEYQARKSRRAA